MERDRETVKPVAFRPTEQNETRLTDLMSSKGFNSYTDALNFLIDTYYEQRNSDVATPLSSASPSPQPIQERHSYPDGYREPLKPCWNCELYVQALGNDRLRNEVAIPKGADLTHRFSPPLPTQEK